MHQPTAWPDIPDNISPGQWQPRTAVYILIIFRAHQYGIAVGPIMNRQSPLLPRRNVFFKRQLHTTHVGGVGWELSFS